MSLPKNLEKSATKYDHSKAYIGYTLFAPIGGTDVWLVDMNGKAIHGWKMPYRSGCDAILLPNGNLLYAGHLDRGSLGHFEGSGGILLEVDWDGNTVWRYEDEYLHHTFCRTDNGNTLVLKWVKTPRDIAARVKGGILGMESSGVLWSDVIQEVTSDGKVVWEWTAFEHLDFDVDTICPLCPRVHWPGLNACAVMPDGNILTSFHKTHNVAIIDKTTGDVKWRWGLGEIAHQNDPSPLASGNILVFDNGLHCHSLSMAFSRVLEVNPQTNEMVWAYQDELRSNFYSSIMGGCQSLPNGNTLICEATEGRIFEITPKHNIVWEYISPFFYQSPYGRSNMLFRAYRYGPDYSGLKGNAPERERFQPQLEEKTTARGEKVYRSEGEEAVQKRLDSLGY